MEQPTNRSQEGRRVVAIDSREERRALMVDVLEENSGRVSVVAEADDRVAALASIEAHRADAVLVDVRMPTPVGLRTIRDLRRRAPQLGIVVCSFHVDRQTMRQVLDAGADAFLPKPATYRELAAALESSHAGAVCNPALVASAT